MRKQTKIAAIASAAALLAIGASMTALAVPGWNDLGDGDYEYHDRYDDPIYDEWKISNDDWYYLGEDGLMVRDQVFRDSADHIFYVDVNGRRVTGWQSFSNDEDLDLNGDGVEDSVLWMYFDPASGKAKKAEDDGAVTAELPWSGGKNIFLFNQDGYMLSGWYDGTVNKGTADCLYYLGTENDGYARTLWQELDVSNSDHVCPDHAESLVWFYFNTNGQATRADIHYSSDSYKSQKIDGMYYTFDGYGHLVDTWAVYEGYGLAT